MTIEEYRALKNKIGNTLKHKANNFSIKINKNISGFNVLYKERIFYILIDYEKITFCISEKPDLENTTNDLELNLESYDYEIIEYIIDMYIKFLFDKNY